MTFFGKMLARIAAELYNAKTSYIMQKYNKGKYTHPKAR